MFSNKKIIIATIVALFLIALYFIVNRMRKTNVTVAKLSAGEGSTTFTPEEAVKMTIPNILKNTVMSLKPFVNMPKPKIYAANEFSIFGPTNGPQGNSTFDIQKILIDKDKDEVIFAAIDGQYVKAVKYKASTGEVISGLYYEHNLGVTGNSLIDAVKTAAGISIIGTPQQPAWNIGGKEGYKIKNKKDENMTDVVKSMTLLSQPQQLNESVYPNIIREGLFFIKSNNKYIFQNELKGLELKSGRADSETFSTTYQSCTKDVNKEQPMVFYLKLKEKDDAKREYTFYVKNFIGNIQSDSSFKNIGIKPFWQAGYNNLEAKFDRGCYDGAEGGFTAKIDPGQKQKDLYSSWAKRHSGVETPGFWNDSVDWYSMPAGLKGTAWWDYFSGNYNYLEPNTKFPSDECGQGRFQRVARDVWDTIRIEYEQPDRLSLAILDSTTDDSSCEFKIKLDSNNKWYIEKDGKFLHFWYMQFPSFVDDFNNRHEVELEPVLDPTMASKYLQASYKWMNTSGVSRDSLSAFCGTNIRFPDGTLKLYPNSIAKDDKGLPIDPIARAFESICACHMNKDFYKDLLCSDEMIKLNFGIDPENPKNKSLLDAIRDDMKCMKPNCTFEKCRNVITNEKNYIKMNQQSTSDNITEGCGSGVICITNQNINIGEGATLQDTTINAESISQCGGERISKPQMLDVGDFIWLDDSKTILGKEQQCFITQDGVSRIVDSKTTGCSDITTKSYIEFNNLEKIRESVDPTTGLKTISLKGITIKESSLDVNTVKEFIHEKLKDMLNLPGISDIQVSYNKPALVITYFDEIPEKSNNNMIYIIILVLLILGAGGYFIMKKK